jgi:hypothetical protein
MLALWLLDKYFKKFYTLSMNILLLIQTVVFISYVGLIIKRYGILPSISDSWYSLPQSENFLFTLFTWGLAIPMLFYGNVWFFLAGVGLSFVGAATQFKMTLGLTSEIHYAGAVLGIFSSLIGIASMYQDLFPLVNFVFFALVLQLSPIKNKLWWQEILAFAVILLGLMVH